MTIQNPADFLQPDRNIVPIGDIAPFMEIPTVDSEHTRHAYIDSTFVPIGEGLIRVRCMRPTEESEIDREYSEDATAITVDEQGEKVEKNARELLRMGHFMIAVDLVSSHPRNTANQIAVDLKIGNQTLDSFSFVNSDANELDDTPNPPDLHGNMDRENLRAYTSYSDDILLPKVMLPKIRLDIKEREVTQE